jgi:hypothetical protein
MTDEFNLIEGFELTEHARKVIAERGISMKWIKWALDSPIRIEKDKSDPQLLHALCRIEEWGGRVLRVIYMIPRSPKGSSQPILTEK